MKQNSLSLIRCVEKDIIQAYGEPQFSISLQGDPDSIQICRCIWQVICLIIYEIAVKSWIKLIKICSMSGFNIIILTSCTAVKKFYNLFLVANISISLCLKGQVKNNKKVTTIFFQLIKSCQVSVFGIFKQQITFYLK